MNFSSKKARRIVMVAWLTLAVTALSLYFFKRDVFLTQVAQIAGLPLVWLGAMYLILGCLRGLTLVPSTYLIVVGLIFLPPWPAYILTVAGVMVSSIFIYYFSDYLGLADYFQQKHPKSIAKLTSVLQKNEIPIVIAWSFFPFTPTDVVCYVCGTLRVDVKKFILGVFIGEGITCAVYVFYGKELLMLIAKSIF